MLMERNLRIYTSGGGRIGNRESAIVNRQS